MKQFKRLLMTSFAALLLFIISCNDATEEPAANETTGDTTVAETAPAPEPAAAAAPQTIMIARHKVKDYAKWKASYDSHDSLRLANGMHSFVIGRGVEDPNMLLVAVKADDVEKAKAFGKSDHLKKAMEAGGVIGTPKIFLANVPTLNTSAKSDLRSISFITVKDWDKWKSHFEANKQERLESGLEDRGYGHDVDDNHKVVVVFSVLDSAKGRAFQKGPAMQKRLDSSGVVGAPDRFWYRVVQTY